MLKLHCLMGLLDAHAALTGSHRGMNAMPSSWSIIFYWPKMRGACITTCPIVPSVRSINILRAKQVGLLMLAPIPDGPSEH